MAYLRLALAFVLTVTGVIVAAAAFLGATIGIALLTQGRGVDLPLPPGLPGWAALAGLVAASAVVSWGLFWLSGFAAGRSRPESRIPWLMR